jgi:hypothetical protein
LVAAGPTQGQDLVFPRCLPFSVPRLWEIAAAVWISFRPCSHAKTRRPLLSNSGLRVLLFANLISLYAIEVHHEETKSAKKLANFFFVLFASSWLLFCL